MDTCIRSVGDVQSSGFVRRRARRWPREGVPLRWASTGRRRKPAQPLGGGGGAPPPSGGGGPISKDDAEWLEKLRPWASSLAFRLGVAPSDVDDAVQETFSRAAVGWAKFEGQPDVPVGTSRRRWLAGILGNVAKPFRKERRRALDEEPYDTVGAEAIVVDSKEDAVFARDVLRGLQGMTTPERWRAWVMYEVDGVAVEEIARQEGGAESEATVYNRLRLARADFAAALSRDAAAAVGPLVDRTKDKRRR